MQSRIKADISQIKPGRYKMASGIFSRAYKVVDKKTSMTLFQVQVYLTKSHCHTMVMANNKNHNAHWGYGRAKRSAISFKTAFFHAISSMGITITKDGKLPNGNDYDLVNWDTREVIHAICRSMGHKNFIVVRVDDWNT